MMIATTISRNALRSAGCALAMVLAAGISSIASAETATKQDSVAPAAKPATSPAVKPAAKARPAHGKADTAKGGAHHPPHAAPASPGAPLPYPGGMIERNAKRLGLSDATVRQMRSVVEMSRTENEKLRKKVEGEQGLLRKMLEQDTPDETAVMAQADKIGTLVTEQRKNQLRAVLKIRGMLTPEQRAELGKMRKDGPGAARGK